MKCATSTKRASVAVGSVAVAYVWVRGYVGTIRITILIERFYDIPFLPSKTHWCLMDSDNVALASASLADSSTEWLYL